MVDDAQNKESMKGAIETLNQIASNNSTPKTIKKSISDLVVDLNKEEYSLSVRAANTISFSNLPEPKSRPEYKGTITSGRGTSRRKKN